MKADHVESARRTLRQRRASHTSSARAWSPSPRVTIPTLLIWGTRDALFMRSEQEALLRIIGTATLAEYDDTGHAVHWERPERFVRDLEAFVARTVASGAAR